VSSPGPHAPKRSYGSPAPAPGLQSLTLEQILPLLTTSIVGALRQMPGPSTTAITPPALNSFDTASIRDFLTAYENYEHQCLLANVTTLPLPACVAESIRPTIKSWGFGSVQAYSDIQPSDLREFFKRQIQDAVGASFEVVQRLRNVRLDYDVADPFLPIDK
jgi:hypothetical protein